jgi:transglutaminase-like putative cysteine protease
MRLRASCELVFESERESPVVVMLRGRRGSMQQIHEDILQVLPALPVSEFVDLFGNVCARFVAPRGQLEIHSQIVAEVAARVAVNATAPRTPIAKLPPEALHYTLPSRYCPSDKMQALALEVTRGCEHGYPEVRAVRDYVHERLSYRYGVSSSTTCALETLEAGAGVCRDFAHVAIALCRSIDIPARMVVGYLHGREPMDLHAWFEAHVGGRWYTLDATEPELRGGRLVLAYGRDAADVAFVTDYGSLKLRTMQVTTQASFVSDASRERLRAAG